MAEIKKTELTITICEDTELALKRAGNAVGFSIGEVIDRMTLNWQVADPLLAAQIILEDLIMNTQHLNNSQINETLFFVFNVLKECGDDFSPQNIKKVVSDRFDHMTN